MLKHFFKSLTGCFCFFPSGGGGWVGWERGNTVNNPSSGPHKIWLNSLKRKMTLTPAVLQSIMYTFWERGGEKNKKDEDSYPSMQVTLRAEGGSISRKRPKFLSLQILWSNVSSFKIELLKGCFFLKHYMYK